jgi:hypothetical protein
LDHPFDTIGHIIQDDVYNHRVVFLHGPLVEARAEMERLGVEEERLPTKKDSASLQEADRCFILWVPTPRNYPLLVHEIYHLVDEAFRYMGIEGDNDSEFGAHLAEFYMREICNYLDG